MLLYVWEVNDQTVSHHSEGGSPFDQFPINQYTDTDMILIMAPDFWAFKLEYFQLLDQKNQTDANTADFGY